VALIALLAGSGRPGAVYGQSLLDPEVAHVMLVEIADLQKGARSEANQEARAEASFKLGGRVQALVDLLDQDAMAHDGASQLAQLLVKRLEEYEVTVAYSEQSRRFSYDQSAMRQYLKLAPKGPHAADARFQILSGAFRATLTLGPTAIAAADRTSVTRAVSEEEQFLRDYPKHPRTKDVRFFLGVDCYRLSRNTADPDKAAQYERCARQALERVIADYPGSVEARASSALMETMASMAPR
jgi:TolA-binding protein